MPSSCRWGRRPHSWGWAMRRTWYLLWPSKNADLWGLSQAWRKSRPTNEQVRHGHLRMLSLKEEAPSISHVFVRQNQTAIKVMKTLQIKMFLQTASQTLWNILLIINFLVSLFVVNFFRGHLSACKAGRRSKIGVGEQRFVCETRKLLQHGYFAFERACKITALPLTEDVSILVTFLCVTSGTNIG